MRHASEAAENGAVAAVLIVDDHPLYSDALGATLEVVFPGVAIEKAPSLAETFGRLDAGFAPDLVMFDLKLPDVSGISGFMALRARLPDTPILVISSLASVDVVRSLLSAGAAGFLPKDASAQTLKSALAEIADGRRYVPEGYLARDDEGDGAGGARADLAALTPQQRKIVRLIADGKQNKQIAYELSLAEATVKAHVTALLRRLGVRNRTQAALLAKAAAGSRGGDDPEARAFLRS
ncbi:MAG: response regulator transcription factor [Pseudomonadota bacterium]